MDLLDDLGLYLADNWTLLLPIGVVGAISWSVWGIRKFLSALYRPIVSDFRTTTSVIVPSYREDPDILEECLETWLAEEPTEVVVVVHTADVETRRRLLGRDDPRIHVIVTPTRGKREGLGLAIRAAVGEILVLTDSDTRWEPGLLAAVQMPFADPAVGGVGTRQNVYRPHTSVWRRVADWIIDNRYLDYVPATGRAGAVVCLSGRTAAYRRSVVLPLLPHLVDEYFLGRRCIAGDDGRLTWLVLAAGHRTVHQSSARALSMFPATFRGFCRQRLRWSRNSYRCYLTALWTRDGRPAPALVAGTRAGPGLAAAGPGAAQRRAPAQAPGGPAAPPPRHPGDHDGRPADQGVGVPDDEQAGLADPARRPGRRRGAGRRLARAGARARRDRRPARPAARAARGRARPPGPQRPPGPHERGVLT
ncbi:MAG: glycosyltransferase [Pseudonocardiales bacterium]|nr:glycosyltransferase [Pseudonocardiales bacterium]